MDQPPPSRLSRAAVTLITRCATEGHVFVAGSQSLHSIWSVTEGGRFRQDRAHTMRSINYTYAGPALLRLPLFLISLVNLFVAGPPLKTIVLDARATRMALRCLLCDLRSLGAPPNSRSHRAMR